MGEASGLTIFLDFDEVCVLLVLTKGGFISTNLELLGTDLDKESVGSVFILLLLPVVFHGDGVGTGHHSLAIVLVTDVLDGLPNGAVLLVTGCQLLEVSLGAESFFKNISLHVDIKEGTIPTLHLVPLDSLSEGSGEPDVEIVAVIPRNGSHELSFGWGESAVHFDSLSDFFDGFGLSLVELRNGGHVGRRSDWGLGSTWAATEELFVGFTEAAGLVSDVGSNADTRAPGTVGLTTVTVGPGSVLSAGITSDGLVAASENTSGEDLGFVLIGHDLDAVAVA